MWLSGMVAEIKRENQQLYARVATIERQLHRLEHVLPTLESIQYDVDHLKSSQRSSAWLAVDQEQQTVRISATVLWCCVSTPVPFYSWTSSVAPSYAQCSRLDTL